MPYICFLSLSSFIRKQQAHLQNVYNLDSCAVVPSQRGSSVSQCFNLICSSRGDQMELSSIFPDQTSPSLLYLYDIWVCGVFFYHEACIHEASIHRPPVEIESTDTEIHGWIHTHDLGDLDNSSKCRWISWNWDCSSMRSTDVIASAEPSLSI